MQSSDCLRRYWLSTAYLMLVGPESFSQVTVREGTVNCIFAGMSFCRGSVNCHGSDGQMYHFCESSRSGARTCYCDDTINSGPVVALR